MQAKKKRFITEKQVFYFPFFTYYKRCKTVDEINKCDKQTVTKKNMLLRRQNHCFIPSFTPL